MQAFSQSLKSFKGRGIDAPLNIADQINGYPGTLCQALLRELPLQTKLP
jgi:hypothetical protein